MGRRALHHAVTAALTAAWTDAESGEVRLITKSNRSTKRAHPRSVLAETDFLTVRAGDEAIDELEDQWAKRESLSMPLIKELNDGAAQTPKHDAAVRTMALVHLVRSFALRDSYFKTADATVADVASALMKNRFARGQWWQERGQAPSLADLEESSRTALAEMKQNGLLLIPAMARIYNVAAPLIARRRVALVRPRSPSVEFLLGDTPLIPLEGVGAGIHNGASVEGAHMLWFPLGPRLGAVLVYDAEVAPLWAPMTVQLANFESWRAAVRFLVARPGADWERSVFGLSLSSTLA